MPIVWHTSRVSSSSFVVVVDRWVEPSQCGVTLEWFGLVLLVAVLEVTLVLVSSAVVGYLSC